MGEGTRVAVVGAGFAGLSAAFGLLGKGWSPTLLSVGAGASSMSSGAADLRPWTEEVRGVVSSGARQFATALGLYGEPGRVVTAEGIVRATDGVGARVLAVDALAGKRIGIARLPRADFRPEEVARRLASTAWAKRTKTDFEVVETPGVASVHELDYPLSAFSRLFDDAERIEALRSAARASSGRIQGLLTGPFLGSARESLDVPGVMIGETLSPPDGAFGSRFEGARSEWTRRVGIEIRPTSVRRLMVEEQGVRLTLESQAEDRSSRGARAPETTLWVDAVVIASGGLIGHGVDHLARDQAPSTLGAMLDPSPVALLGAHEGWDASLDGGAWILPPHYRRGVSAASARIILAGDVRGEASRRAPPGTVFGAIQSGLDAAERLLAR